MKLAGLRFIITRFRGAGPIALNCGMNKVYLLLGSNLEDPTKQILKAEAQIDRSVGTIVRKSGLYQTEAWGMRNQPDFINRVVICETSLTPFATLEAILKIEKKMGRERGIKNAPRIIDIDILFFGKQILKSAELTIPHPRIEERRFVLTPLKELSPLFKHPVSQKNISRLLEQCYDPLHVKRI